MYTIDVARPVRALACLSALSVGDAFGAQFSVPGNQRFVAGRELPPGPWQWTDDTEMAASVYAEVVRGGAVDADRLAASFARHHDVDREYGAATGRMLRLVRQGGDWRSLASEPFEGAGSYGNGAAMRVAPLGAWYAEDLDEVVEQARVSARVTHTHPEAVDGAVAVAVAAALVARRETLGAGSILDRVVACVPRGRVREAVRDARALLVTSNPLGVAQELGNGSRASALDTVPFALWVVARHRSEWDSALWASVAPGADTVCAIVAGVLGAGLTGGALPREWVGRTEELPAWALASAQA
jgi:ADP-ribosylglycohydrolase